MTKSFFLLFLIAIGFTVIAFDNNNNNTAALGLWIPQSSEELMENSHTVLVGIITSVDVLKFEQQQQQQQQHNNNDDDDDSSRYQSEDNYSKTIDKYTVLVEEFLKNPQDSDIITVLQATASRGGPGGVQPVTEFELGDRVLLYITKTNDNDDNNDTHKQNQYYQESFVIPEYCDAKTVSEQLRLTSLLNDYAIMQDGVAKKDNFTVNIPMQFVYQMDLRTLDEDSFDFQIAIRKESSADTGKFDDTVLSKKVTAVSPLCQWIATASVEFTPEKEGNYKTWIHVDEGSGQHTSSGEFFVKSENVTSSAVLKQSKLKTDDSVLIQPEENKDIEMIQKHDVVAHVHSMVNSFEDEETYMVVRIIDFIKNPSDASHLTIWGNFNEFKGYCESNGCTQAIAYLYKNENGIYQKGDHWTWLESKDYQYPDSLSKSDDATSGCNISNVISERISIAYSREDVILFVEKNIKDGRKIQEKILYNSVTNQQDIKLTIFAQKGSNVNMMMFFSNDCFETIRDPPTSLEFIDGSDSHFGTSPPRLNQHHDIYVSEYESHAYKKCAENIREVFVLVKPESIDKLTQRGYLIDDMCRIP